VINSRHALTAHASFPFLHALGHVSHVIQQYRDRVKFAQLLRGFPDVLNIFTR
jgi:hypothetical protein